jgi:hypothetical protein
VTMITPGGASTLPPLDNILELLQGSAHRLLSWGRSFLVYLAPALRSAYPDETCSYQDDQGRGILRGVLPAPLLRGER